MGNDDESIEQEAIDALVRQVRQIVAESGDGRPFDPESWVARFLDAPHPALGYFTPRAMLVTTEGCSQVKLLVARMQSGAYG